MKQNYIAQKNIVLPKVFRGALITGDVGKAVVKKFLRLGLTTYTRPRLWNSFSWQVYVKLVENFVGQSEFAVQTVCNHKKMLKHWLVTFFTQKESNDLFLEQYFQSEILHVIDTNLASRFLRDRFFKERIDRFEIPLVPQNPFAAHITLRRGPQVTHL